MSRAGSRSLQSFVDAQSNTIDDVFKELKDGKKQSHWMWFIFPQLTSLGRSATAKTYGIDSIEEAQAYLSHSTLGERLIKCTEAVLGHSGRGAHEIFGSPDDLKFKSCMTLFREADPQVQTFDLALKTFFDGVPDHLTLNLLTAPKV
jgi:uncharacterized protein (DUF1810 family)